MELLKAQGIDYSVPEATLDAVRDSRSSAPVLSLFSHTLLCLLQENGAFYSYLPLAAFDSTDFEIRTPAQWLDLLAEDASDAKVDESAGLPARALERHADGTGVWKDALVVGYNTAEEKYVVSAGSPAVTSLVSRLELCFAAEDPVNFAQRVGFAFRSGPARVLLYRLSPRSVFGFAAHAKTLPRCFATTCTSTVCRRMTRPSWIPSSVVASWQTL